MSPNGELEICFRLIDTGDKCLNALLFFKQHIKEMAITRWEAEKIIDYLRADIFIVDNPKSLVYNWEV